MNRPDKAGEQSMEEILASIRQIIADEPSADHSAQPVEPNPLVPKSSISSAGSPTSQGTPPLLDRLNGVLRNGSLPPTSPLGSKRPLSFDQDLADMFDEQDDASSGAVIAPKPAEIRVPPDPSFGGDPKSTATNNAFDTAASKGASSFSPSQPSRSQPFLPPLPFGSADSGTAKEETPSPPDPPPPRNFGFPPLRKQGFYPPQNATPVLPSLPAADAPTTTAASPVESAEDTLKRVAGLGAVVPGTIGSGIHSGTSASSPFGAPTGSRDTGARDFGRANDQRASSFDVEPGYRPASGTPVTMPSLETPAPFRSSSFDAMAADGAPYLNGSGKTSPYFATENVSDAVVETVVPEVEAKADETKPFDIAPVPPVADKPSVDRPFIDRPLSSGQPGVSQTSVQEPPFQERAPRFSAAPPSADTTAVASVAAQALDALAHGLAASAAASAFAGGASPSQAAIPLTPIVEPSAATPQPFNALTTPSASGGAPVGRTLEDAVADMLRPMLQQWVADNMPRIIEKALRNEVTKSIKPGSK